MTDKTFVARQIDGEIPLNTKRAARYLRRDKRTLYNLVWGGELSPDRGPTGRLLFRRSELDQFLAQRGEAPGDPD